MGDITELNMYKTLFGSEVVCTNGLYHIFDEDHSEFYINASTKKISDREKYHTIVVLDDIVLAEVVNNSEQRYIILNKYNLNCLFSTKGKIEYIDKNLMYCKEDNKTILIAHTGKILCTLYNVSSIIGIEKNKYLIKSEKSYSDKIYYYNRYRIKLVDLTEERRYIINKKVNNNGEDLLEISLMQGTVYIYNFATEKFFNTFTNKEEQTFLWNLSN